MSEKPEGKYKSHIFTCGLVWTGDRTWDITADAADTIKGSPPPVFGGSEDRWSPEDLLLASIDTCHLATFVSYCKRKNFEFVSYESEIEGILEHDGTNIRITKVVIRPRVVVKSEGDIETAEEYLHKAHGACFIGNSVNAEIKVEPVITVESEG